MSDIQHYVAELESEVERLRAFVDAVVGRRYFSWGQIIDAAEKVNRGRS